MTKTMLLKNNGDLRFENFFDLQEVQNIQDNFAMATGVASLITSPDGIPLTRPSNFTRLCSQVIRGTRTGSENCMRSDALLGAYNPHGPSIRRCMSGGLWDAGVSITVGGRHVANWLIGQVRSSLADEEAMLGYAKTIGADPQEYREAMNAVPFMEEEQFRRVADALFVIANSLSEKAYQQTMLLEEKKERQKMDAMREMLMDRSLDAIIVVDQNHRIIEANRRFADMLGYTPAEVLGLRTWDYEANMTEGIIKELFSDFSQVNSVFETRHRRKDGSIFDVEVTTAGASIDGRSCILAFSRDITTRKEAERQLRQSEKHFRALFELSRDGFILADAEGRFLDANKAYCDMTGYSLPELRALGDFYALTPEKWHDWQRDQIWTRLFTSGDTGVYRKEYIHKDGHVFPVELRDFAVHDDHGVVRYAWGIVRDISERVRTEERMHALMQMVEQSPVCIVMTDPQGNIEYVNPKFTELSGYSFDEARGQNPRILGSGYKSREEYQELWHTIESGQQWRGEFRNRHKDGSLYWESALIAPILDPDGRITHYVAIKEDITKRRHTEEELRKRDINFKKIVDILPQLVSYIDKDLRYRFVNATYSSFFSPGNLIGNTVPEVIGEKAFEATRGHIEQVFQGKTVHYGATLTYPELGERFVDVYLIPDYSSHGVVDGYYAILNDLTHLKRIEDSLRLAKDEAEAANKLKSEFLANMSHEIRTPLNGVLGMLQLMQGSNLDAEQQECLHTAIKSSERLTRLLSDILDISKIEADRLVFREHAFDIMDVKKALTELFGQTVKDAGITYSVRVDPRLPKEVLGDEARLVQILFNLVGNSLKFADKGNVTVDIAPLPFTAGAPLRLLFCVTDTGLGMSEQTQRDIFEPFIQSDGSYTRRYQGVGLGLTIVRKLVQRMGGSLCLDSVSGQGTSVYVSLPFRLPPDRSGEDVASCGQCDGVPGLRLLMVEDDAVNLLCGQRLLEKSGYVVTTARDGQEALEVLMVHDFDLVLMDIQMPVLDGIQTTRAIRHAAPFAHVSTIPIIALTAHAMAGDQEKFLAAEMDGYLSKPFDICKINQEIARVVSLPRRGARQAD
ncbi:PAS domain S-box protein [Desulfomicrobium sp. ZS1]|jgi:PAS domain S-box-containing protein|uniref:PAS domain S-box protein n=1 Tax=Desulfomicrobium sp. ZS1 TaxID=2952228 RepID=UPI0020B422C1|nr:PAS domain S-box protein [Desulfomicrobium sp. ZS1]UTF51553.1 PAS domain S-box protein [Desulfomicrobium sp. ZS1]